MTALARQTDRAEWLDWRRRGIGASDAPAILGVSPYRTPLDVFLDKIGEAEEEPPNMAMRIGTAMEPAILDLFEQETGEKVERVQERAAHPQIPFVRATLDAICESGRVVEVKTTAFGRGLGEEVEDDLPESWIVQAQHQCLAHEAEQITFAVLIGGRDFRIYEVRRDQEFIDLMLATEIMFWRMVEGRVMPPPTMPRDRRHDARLFGRCEGEIELPPEALMDVEALEAAREARKAADQTIDRLKSGLIHHLGTHASGTLPDGRIVTKRLVRVEEQIVTRKAYEYLDLRVKTPKGGRR